MTNEQQPLFGTEVRGTDRDHALARFTDPQTSNAADAHVRQREGAANVIKRGTHRHRALLRFSSGPKTAEEIQKSTGIDGIWKRVSDLKNMGFIEPTGETRRSSQGREQDVLEITESGRAALQALWEDTSRIVRE